MPLFYFDYDDGKGSGLLLDRVGTELADIQAALDEASRAMAELAADALPGSQGNSLGIIVRDESGDTRMKVLLDYRVEAAG